MRLEWGQTRDYEDGVSQAVLYSDGLGVAWNGLVGVDDSEAGGENVSYYFDGLQVAVTQNSGDFQAAIQAYTYPDELDYHIGYLDDDRRLRRFGLSYRTHGSAGDKLHLVYNALIKSPDRGLSTIGRSLAPTLFRWDIQTHSINIPGAQPGSHLVVDTAHAKPELVELVEGWLYGTDTTEPHLPDPEEIIDAFEVNTTLRIRNNGDGTWTATGPDHIVQVHGDGSFTITAPTLQFLDEGIFVVDSF